MLAAVPILVGIAVKIETSDGSHGRRGRRRGGPAFIAQITNNGLFLVFTALAATLPFFLPMAVGVVAGDAIAGEASAGTLRYLLVAPAGRTRLLLAKYATTLTFCLVATLVVAVSALAVGALLFPLGEVTTISGTRIGFGEGLVRALLIALVVAVSLIGVAALGLFVSTLTSSGIAAMATTVGLLITVQILDQIPQLHGLQPYFFSHYWLSFADLMREPVYWTDIVKNLRCRGCTRRCSARRRGRGSGRRTSWRSRRGAGGVSSSYGKRAIGASRAKNVLARARPRCPPGRRRACCRCRAVRRRSASGRTRPCCAACR